MASMENDPLAAYLAALARDDCYRVDEVLKTAPHETTEVVYFVGGQCGGARAVRPQAHRG